MTWSLVTSSIDASSSTSFTTSAINTTGADLVVVVTSGFVPNGAPGISSDSKGNTWSGGPAVGVGNSYLFMYYAWNPIVGSGHTVSLSGSRFYTTIVLAYSGAKTSADPLDVSSQNSSASATTLGPGSVVTTLDNELLVAGTAGAGNAWGSGGGPLSIDSSFTIQRQAADGTDIACGAADFVQVTHGGVGVNPTWTFNATVAGACAVLAAFKPPAGATFVAPPGKRILQAVNRAGTY